MPSNSATRDEALKVYNRARVAYGFRPVTETFFNERISMLKRLIMQKGGPGRTVEESAAKCGSFARPACAGGNCAVQIAHDELVALLS